MEHVSIFSSHYWFKISHDFQVLAMTEDIGIVIDALKDSNEVELQVTF